VDRTPSATEFTFRVDGGVDYFLTREVSTFFDVATDGAVVQHALSSLSAGVKYNSNGSVRIHPTCN
jgi:hypothetical protein